MNGCDLLVCENCSLSICWATKLPRWGPAGKGDISGGCRCGVDNKKCHPDCIGCHLFARIPKPTPVPELNLNQS